MRTSRRKTVIAIGLTAAFVLAACGSDAKKTSTTAAPLSRSATMPFVYCALTYLIGEKHAQEHSSTPIAERLLTRVLTPLR